MQPQLDGLRCSKCGEALPPGYLLGPEGTAIPLGPSDLVVGRDVGCDLVIDHMSVSRRHARISWTGSGFEIADSGSSYGTFLNQSRLPEDRVPLTLQSGDQVRFGSVQYRLLLTGPAVVGDDRRPLDDYSRLARELTSLDPAAIVSKGLELLRLVSGVERSYLVSAGVEPGLEPLLTRLDDPSLDVSRSSIARSLDTGETVALFFSGRDPIPPTKSIARLNLRRVWAHPVIGVDGTPVAAVYLDSPNEGMPFPAPVERDLVTVVEHIGMALRNATLHARVVSFNRELESRVAARTNELEASRAQLVSQDRLVTLGRLVAGIAHELNNPVGAIASFSNTLGALLAPMVRLDRDLRAALPDPGDQAGARGLIGLALETGGARTLDTSARRALEEELGALLQGAGAPQAGSVARRLARIGLVPDRVRAHITLLVRHGEAVSELAERVHIFGRGLATISDCAGNLARIVDGLKIYSHLDRAEYETADVHRGIQATLTVLAPRIPTGIEIATRFADLPPIAHRPGELTQVWTNLVDNALRAMGERGTLTVETADATDSVVVRVTDTGPGIPARIRDRVFELDSTTRGPGAGLGLGLPICRAIVEENHHGSIGFESEPGRTVFTVRLPKRQPSAGEA